MDFTVICTLTLLLRIFPLVATNRRENYGSILRQIQQRNNNNLIPPLPESGRVPVEVSFYLHRVITLISHSATLQVSGMIRVSWTDERFAWAPTSGVDHILLPMNQVWLPELSLSTAADFSLKPTNGGCNSGSMIIIFNNGRMVIERNMRLEVACDIDVHYFPKDVQYCHLSFMPSVTYRDLIHTIAAEPHTTPLPENIGEEWKLLQSVHQVQMVPVFHPNGSIMTVNAYRLRMLLYRNHAFYFLTIIVPSLMLCMFTLVPHLIPPDFCAPKIIIPVTTFLSFNIYMLLLERSLPKAVKVPVLGQVYAILLAACTLTELIQAISVKMYVCRLSHVPWWLSFLYFRVLAGPFCLRRRRAIISGEKDETETHDEHRHHEEEIKERWMRMGRINDRFGLFICSVLILFAFLYLFIRCYSSPRIPDAFTRNP